MVLYIHHGQWRKLQQLLILQASQKCTRWDVISQTCFALTKEDTDKTVYVEVEQVYVLINKAASAGSSNVWVYIQYMYCPLEYGKGNEGSDED
jgi:hypothetical protein